MKHFLIKKLKTQVYGKMPQVYGRVSPIRQYSNKSTDSMQCLLKVCLSDFNNSNVFIIMSIVIICDYCDNLCIAVLTGSGHQ